LNFDHILRPSGVQQGPGDCSEVLSNNREIRRF
jgi:hypothetical protein